MAQPQPVAAAQPQPAPVAQGQAQPVATTGPAPVAYSPSASSEPIYAEAEEAEADPYEDDRRVSITFSPIHLLFPVFELTVEARIAHKLGVAIVAGGGTISSDDVEYDDGSGVRTEEITATVWEAGAQVRYYVFGGFDHGMQLGAEALYVHVSVDDVGSTNVSGTGEGLGIGPFVGYKIATRAGFTFDGQLGLQYYAVQAEASDDTGESASDEESAVAPMLNLNVGWSF